VTITGVLLVNRGTSEKTKLQQSEDVTPLPD